jgi:formylglycine-generating enzyme required for sulfatase activity
MLGRTDGDPDERPVHPVAVSGFWLTEAPLSWDDYCRILGWSPPPKSEPADPPAPKRTTWGATFYVGEANRIRRLYCEDLTSDARKAHERFYEQRTYQTKPMVAVGWQDAEEVAAALSGDGDGARYRLPTEAEWETAARGGLVGRRHPWGDDPPTGETCDVDRFDELGILPSRSLPPNGYGLYAMCGGVWEWTADWYDARYYDQCPPDNPTGPATGEQKAIRGGSWTDCADVATVSFRASRASVGWRAEDWGQEMTANIGFRLCRVAQLSDAGHSR